MSVSVLHVHVAHRPFFFILCQATSDHYAIGLKILNQLVSEMNQVSLLISSKFYFILFFIVGLVGSEG